MPATTLPHTGAATASAPPPSAGAPAAAKPDVAALLRTIDAAAATQGKGSAAQRDAGAAEQQKLVEGRLGMAASLFAALRCKHPATAEHSLRVALGCSAWAAALKMPDKLRTQLEAAALLHDIGKIGVPDAILNKPGRLTEAELDVIDSCRADSRHVLRAAGAPEEVIEGVAAASAWFDGAHRSVSLRGDQTPFVARMIAIVDAFDSMTTDQVYRPARSRDRAVATLYERAGTQFDPELVRSYCELFNQDQSRLEADVAARWLHSATTGWTPTILLAATSGDAAEPGGQRGAGDLFTQRLVENMHDAVVFLDSQRRITHWNTGAERLTGVGAAAALGKEFSPSLLDMATVAGEVVDDGACPVRKAIADGIQALERLCVMGRNGQSVTVDVHVIPVSDPGRPGCFVGAAVVMHDVSSEASLEERCQALHAEMTKDPMTQVANRAEFDRMLAAFVEAHLDTDLRCSLIMADIDHFKCINDTFGHQAGDEAIMTFAGLMKSMCRAGDLVARYGGEEFAILCADCNNATAVRRAEAIRTRLSETPHSYLGGKHITASFGVTELQSGDTPETLLRRSDRALLMAKDQGRNQVVQLGDGMQTDLQIKTGWGGLGKWLLGSLSRGGALIETRLVTNVPVELAVDKLRGFIADRDASVVKTSENFIRLIAEESTAGTARRSSDQPVSFVVELRLSQEHVERTNSAGLAAGKYVHTYIDVKIEPRRDRDRGKAKVVERARQLLASLQAYLMAREATAKADTPQAPTR